MKAKESARNGGNRSRALNVHCYEDKPIISDYERGAKWAGWAFVALFAFLSLGCVLWGW